MGEKISTASPHCDWIKTNSRLCDFQKLDVATESEPAKLAVGQGRPAGAAQADMDGDGEMLPRDLNSHPSMISDVALPPLQP